MRGSLIAFGILSMLALVSLQGSSLAIPVAAPSVPDANRAVVLHYLPSFVASDPAILYQGTDPNVAGIAMTAGEALQAHLDFLAANGVDLRETAPSETPSAPTWPLLYRVRVDEAADIQFAPAGEVLKCPTSTPLNEPLPTAYNTVWPATYPNIPTDVRSTLFLPAIDSKAAQLTSRLSFSMDPNGAGASATSFTPGDDPSDPVDLQKTVRYQDETINMGPIVKFSCFQTKDLQGNVKTARLSVTVNGIVDQA